MNMAKQFVTAVYPSAKIKREGVKVMVIRKSTGLAGWTPISDLHYSEAAAWDDAQSRLPVSID